MENKELIAYNFYVSKGWTPAQAAGIVSNLKAESGFKTTAAGDKGHNVKVGDRATSGSHGIAQWNGARLLKLQDMYGDKWTDFKNQLEYVHWELLNTEKGAGDKLRGAKTSAQAADIVTRYYERPKNKDKDSKHRQGLANELTQKYIGNNLGESLKTPGEMAKELIPKGFSGIDTNKYFDQYEDEDYEYSEEDPIITQLLDDEPEEVADSNFLFGEEPNESELKQEEGLAGNNQTEPIVSQEEEFDFESNFENYLRELEEERNYNSQMALNIFSDFDDEGQESVYQFMQEGGEVDSEQEKEKFMFNLPQSVREMTDNFSVQDQVEYLNNEYEINKLMKKLR